LMEYCRSLAACGWSG